MIEVACFNLVVVRAQFSTAHFKLIEITTITAYDYLMRYLLNEWVCWVNSLIQWPTLHIWRHPETFMSQFFPINISKHNHVNTVFFWPFLLFHFLILLQTLIYMCSANESHSQSLSLICLYPTIDQVIYETFQQVTQSFIIDLTHLQGRPSCFRMGSELFSHDLINMGWVVT